MAMIITITVKQLKKYAPSAYQYLKGCAANKFYHKPYSYCDSEQKAVIDAEIELNEYSSVKEINQYFNSLTNKEQFLK